MCASQLHRHRRSLYQLDVDMQWRATEHLDLLTKWAGRSSQKGAVGADDHAEQCMLGTGQRPTVPDGKVYLSRIEILM